MIPTLALDLDCFPLKNIIPTKEITRRRKKIKEGQVVFDLFHDPFLFDHLIVKNFSKIKGQKGESASLGILTEFLRRRIRTAAYR